MPLPPTIDFIVFLMFILVAAKRKRIGKSFTLCAFFASCFLFLTAAYFGWFGIILGLYYIFGVPLIINEFALRMRGPKHGVGIQESIETHSLDQNISIKPVCFFCLLVCTLLGLSFCDMPYGYDEFLYLVISVFCVYAIWKLGSQHEIKQGLLVIIFLAYQPFVSIPFKAEAEMFVNMSTIILFLGLLIPWRQISWWRMFLREIDGVKVMHIWVLAGILFGLALAIRSSFVLMLWATSLRTNFITIEFS